MLLPLSLVGGRENIRGNHPGSNNADPAIVAEEEAAAPDNTNPSVVSLRRVIVKGAARDLVDDNESSGSDSSLFNLRGRFLKKNKKAKKEKKKKAKKAKKKKKKKDNGSGGGNDTGPGDKKQPSARRHLADINI